MQDKKVIKNIVIISLFSVVSAVFGILEGFIPLNVILPVPGVKLGFANIVIIAVYYFYGKKDAFFVSVIRMFLSFLFFSNPVSLFMSLSGGLMSFLSLVLLMPNCEKKYTFVGVSCTSAVFHSIGQMLCAYFVVGKMLLLYLPVLCFFSALTGILTGIVLNVVIKKIKIHKRLI